MRYDLVRKKYLIVILILIIIFSTYLFFSANNLKIKTENFTPNEITLNYQIKPENKSLLSSEADLSYLTVQTPPFDRKYPLILLKEKFDLLTRAHDHLFFAEKRLAELNKWGNDLDWGDNLGRYYQYMNQYIDTSADYSAIKQKLNAHQNTINKLIDHLEKNEKEKLALYQKAEKIFNQLNAKIPAYLQQFSQNEISYPLTEIVENKDYGVYNAVIEEDQPVFFKNLNLKLKLNKKQYPSSLEPETNICVFESIDIPITNEKSHPHLQLILPAISLTPYLNWDEKKIGNTYHYYTALPNLPKGEYIVKLTSKIVQPVELKLEHKYQKIKSDEGQWQRLDKIKTDTLLETTVYPSSSSQTSYHQFLIPEEKDMVSIEPILISKSRPLLITPNGDIWLDIYPYWTPEITLIKIDSNRDYYLAKAQDKADLQKKIALTLGIGSLAFLIYIVFKRIIIILLSLIGLTILQFINFLSRKIRQLWLITAIIGIIIDIFYFSQTSDLIIILLTLIWILAIVGYRLEARFSFLSAIIFLILCPILLILNKPLIAEKAAIWVYMMLLVGTFQSLIELKNKFTELITLEDLILKILKNQQVKKLKKILKNNLDNIKLRFFHLIDAIFCTQTKK